MSETDETIYKGDGGHEGNSGWWRNRVIAPARRFYNDPPDDLNAFFWINFVLPALFYFTISYFLSGVGYALTALTPRPIYGQAEGLSPSDYINLFRGVLKLLSFALIQALNIWAAHRFLARRNLFRTFFALNFLALPMQTPAFLPSLLALSAWPGLIVNYGIFGGTGHRLLDLLLFIMLGRTTL